MARIDDVREIAEKVMGWQVKEATSEELWLERPDKGTYCWWFPKITRRHDLLWDPFNDANAALEVVEAMREKGYGIYCCAKKAYPDGWLPFFEVAFNRAEETVQLQVGTFCEAICKAALAAVRSEP